MIELILMHSKDIMYLLVGISVFIISVSLTQTLIQAVQLLKRINRVSATIEQYLQKPILILKQIDAFLGRFF